MRLSERLGSWLDRWVHTDTNTSCINTYNLHTVIHTSTDRVNSHAHTGVHTQLPLSCADAGRRSIFFKNGVLFLGL